VRASSGFRKTRKRIPMTVSSMWALMMASSLVTYTRNPRSTYLDSLNNLALACQRCNAYRYNFTEGIDPEDQISTPLFNPRLDTWNDHFAWKDGGLTIVGTTTKGRATCTRLDLNDENHNDGAIVKARRLWMKGGWHPPSSDAVVSG
jgi:hypothetical protein